MKELLCITEVTLTEYNGSKRVVNLAKDKLIIQKLPRVITEDLLCKIFSNKEFLYIRASWKSRECTLSEQIEYKHLINDKTVWN